MKAHIFGGLLGKLLLAVIILVAYFHFRTRSAVNKYSYKNSQVIIEKEFIESIPPEPGPDHVNSLIAETKINSSNYKLNSSTPYLTTSPIKILFMTEYRTGSTFISSLLNKHPGIFYLFEPLYLCDNRPESELGPENNYDSKENMINCQRRSLEEFYSDCLMPNTSNYLTNEMIREAQTTNIERRYLYHWCSVDGICFRHKSEIFKQPPFCDQAHPEDGIKASRLARFPGCKDMRFKLDQAQELCRNDYIARSTKVIRLRSIQDLPDSLKFDENFKIIYLVRDPRGITASRFNIQNNNWNENAAKKLKSICQNFHRFIQERVENAAFPNSKWKSKVMVVRYEDFALNPLIFADRIYDFLKISDDSRRTRVKAHLQSITHGDVSKLDETRNGEPCTYCTVRDSEKIIFKWGQSLDWFTVDIVQQHCKTMFDTFGYKMYRDELEYLADLHSGNFTPILHKNCTTCEF